LPLAALLLLTWGLPLLVVAPRQRQKVPRIFIHLFTGQSTVRSLLLKIFLSFWLIIVVTFATAGVAGFLYAERMRDAIESFEVGDAMLDASAALEAGGREGLADWVRNNPASRTITLFVLDERGHDILERRVPFMLTRAFHRHREHPRRHEFAGTDPRNLRRSRPYPQLVAADGSVYTFFVAPPRGPRTDWTTADARWLLFFIALVASGTVSWFLASAISAPVRKLRDATVALAGGDLAVRVADSVGKRRDELGLLGKDFDAMAENLQGAATRQSELSRNISHELRSPLARMRVAIELAKQKSGDLPEFERLDDEAERIDSLIGQILSYTKLDASPERDPEPIDLADVIREVAENVNYECKAEGIDGVSVVAQIDASPVIRGHADAMTSAIENVVRNAVHHSPPDSEVKICLGEEDDKVLLDVRDSGPGVDAAELPRLFEPFFRTRESAESKDAGGTGLGLAIAERAVLINGGTISARNHPDGGLLVRIALPL
jgi:two-component system sensor histidine kinase CpxA